MPQLATKPPPAATHELRGAIRISRDQRSPWDDLDLERLSEANPGWKFELDLNGELVINMHAGGDSGDIESVIAWKFGNWRFGGGGGGRPRTSQSGYWPGGVAREGRFLIPDYSWVSSEQVAALSGDEMRRSYAVCPAFVLEIRSPSQSLGNQQERMELWMSYGVELGWLIDPSEETVWIYRPDREPEHLDRPAMLSGEDVMVGLEVEMSEVWALVDESKARSQQP